MRIAIISDIHDNLPNLEKALVWCARAGAEKMICCGDVTNGDTLAILYRSFAGPIALVRGNMEIYEPDEPGKYPRIDYLGRSGTTTIDGRTVGVCHEPAFIPGLAARRAEIVFYGHTHKPWDEVKDGVRLVNPGNLAGVINPATFAFWDTADDVLTLKILAEI